MGADRKRQMIDFRICKAESKGSWAAFSEELKVRGLRTNWLRLVITDGGKGLISAVAQVFPFVDHQLYWFHKLKNVAAKLPRKYQQRCICEARRIYKLDKLLVFFECPVEHRRSIRTTNVIERNFRELRRRLRVMGSFQDKASAERMLCALMTFYNNRWERT